MNIPALLAGPIVRRATADSVYIWFATSNPMTLEVVVKHIDLSVAGSGKSTDQPLAHIQLGKRLHLYLIQIKPNADLFPQDQLLYYDVLMDGQNLAALGLVNADPTKSLNYPNHPLPSFFIPKQLQTILHGSCRRLEAGTPAKPIPDQLTIGDRAIAESVTVLTSRPSHLFLTGDQIYGDQISTPLLAAILPLAQELAGKIETIPGEKGPLPDQRITPANTKFDMRDTLLRNTHSGLTSGTSGNHLMTFSEYAALYLISWGNPDLVQIPAVDTVRSRFQAYPLDTLMDEVSYKQTIHLIEHFQQGLWKVRRLLANISVMMITDDHDVSDDWNIDTDWRTKVEGNPVGRAIVSNALAAYWGFQAWGNQPGNYERGFLDTLEKSLTAAQPEVSLEKAMQELLLKQHWEYALPTYPPCLVMDCRTGRKMGGEYQGAQLLDAARIKELVRLGQQVKQQLGYAVDQPIALLLITPTPVIGFEKIEFLQSLLPFNNAWMDRESWSANQDGRTALLNCLSKQLFAPLVTILSGDVHYSFVRKQKIGDTQYVQCTSSALKNAPTGGLTVGHLDRKDLKNSESYVQPIDHPHIIESKANLGRVCFDTEGRPLYQDLLIDAVGTQNKGQYLRYPTALI